MNPQRFQITRVHVFATFFVIVGLLMLWQVPGNFEADAISKMSLGQGKDAPIWEAPTQATLLTIAVLFLAGGITDQDVRQPSVGPVFHGRPAPPEECQ